MLMHLSSVSLALLAASSTILSSPLPSRTEYAVKDTHNVPSKWYEVGPAPAHKLLHLHIGLKQSQFDELERHLYEGMSAWSLSSPGPHYAQAIPQKLHGTANPWSRMNSLDAFSPSLWSAPYKPRG